MFAKKEKLESFIGRNSQFKGDITIAGTLRVDGSITGSIEAECLIMGNSSHIAGDARVKSAVIGGQLDGNIYAKELVEIKHTGQIKGDVATTKLMVVEGGQIDGRITMQKEASKIVELSQEKAGSSRVAASGSTTTAHSVFGGRTTSTVYSGKDSIPSISRDSNP